MNIFTLDQGGFLDYNIHKVKLSNGCNVAYIDEGSGEQTLLFIHGLALYAKSWTKNIEYLKQDFRCIAIDLPGNGYSDKGDYPYGIHFFAGCIYDFMQRLNLRNVAVVAHSMGSQIAVELVTGAPSCCEKLVLCAPAGFETFKGWEKAIYKSSIHLVDFFSTEENSLRKVIYSSFFKQPKQSDDMITELVTIMKSYSISHYRKMIEGCLDGMLNEEVFDKLKLIQQSTLVIYGERDALIPNRFIHPITTRQLAEEGVKQIPNAKLILYPDCGHFVQIECADAVNKNIEGFVKCN